jgi:hypothetical protein
MFSVDLAGLDSSTPAAWRRWRKLARLIDILPVHASVDEAAGHTLRQIRRGLPAA